MKQLFSFIIIVLLASVYTIAQDKKVIETEFKVSGNCNMCKERIEKAVKIDEVKFARWNKNTKNTEGSIQFFNYGRFSSKKDCGCRA